MTGDGLLHAELLERLAALAQEALPLWDLPAESAVALINLSENATYRIDPPGAEPLILRIHREGYNSVRAIQCELAWAEAIRRDTGIVTPEAIPGRDGQIIQSLQGPLPRPRFLELFRFIAGREPLESDDLTAPFENLGETSARLHRHALGWQRPEPFARLTWDFDRLIGVRPNWGPWRAAPALSKDGLALLERTEGAIASRLERFGQAPERYNLIHADLRLANLLIHEGTTRVIDFDDCGFGWFLYDFATAVSFIEHKPEVPALAEAWLAGYRRVRPLPAEEAAEIPTFIMLRRMTLMAWIASHAETDLAQEMGAAYTQGGCDLAERYLSRFG